MGRAIVREPQVFLMDEPLSNLDAKLRVQTRTQIAALQRRLGVTTVYVTHDQVEAMTMGDRVAVLKDGVLQQVRHAAASCTTSPVNVFVAGFIGSPAMNLFEPVPRTAACASATPRSRSSESVRRGRPATAARRAPRGPARWGDRGLPVEVDVVEELGADAYVYGHAVVDGGPANVVARVRGRSLPARGAVLQVAPRPGSTHLFAVGDGARLG